MNRSTANGVLADMIGSRSAEKELTTAWTSEKWCRALAERFFPEDVHGLPVLFFVDDEALTEIYADGNRDDAIASLADVVWRRLGHAGDLNGYFHSIERQGRRWKLAGGQGCPPFLDLLAVCVLAATHMGQGNYAAHNYYAQLKELLEISEPGTPAGFADSLDYLWQVYTWWLDVHLGGVRGLSTVIEDAAFSHIGRPISQTLFLGSDIRRLDDFFRWMQLDPSEEVDEDVLVLHFRAWAPGQSLSTGARRLLEDSQFWPTLGRIVGAYARQWDGTRFDHDSTRSAALRVVVRLRLPRSVTLQAAQPEGYPDRLGGQLGGAAASASAVDGVFVVGAADPRQLLRGGMVGDEACRLTFAAGEVFVLQLDEVLGGWASVTSFVPGERHYVLAAPSVSGDVGQQLERTSTSPLTTHQLPGAFGAWTLYGDVMLQGNETLEGVLAERRPSLKHRFAFRGGLPLGISHSYLSGGPPDVWLPPTTDPSLWVTIDGQRVNTFAERVRLADHLPDRETASHVIGYGGMINRTISVIESHLLVPPEHDQPGHALEAAADGETAAHRMVSRVDDAPEGAITVVGPHVEGASDQLSEAPVLLHRHAERAWLLGREPWQVIVVEKPPKPAWMVKQRLTGHLFEAHAPFHIQYSVEQWRAAEPPNVRQHGEDEPGELEFSGDVSSWAEVILSAQLGGGDPDLWAEYQAAAKLVQSEVGRS